MMDAQAKIVQSEIQTTMLNHLFDGACKTVDQLDNDLALTRRQISKAACKLIVRGLVERVELGCYQLTPKGQGFVETGGEIKSGPRSKYTCKVRKARKSTLRQRAWQVMRMGGVFTISSLTRAATTTSDKQPENNLHRYIHGLAKAKYILELPVRERGAKHGSNGFKRFRLVKNTGPLAPAIRQASKSLFDRNLNEGAGGEVSWT